MSRMVNISESCSCGASISVDSHSMIAARSVVGEWRQRHASCEAPYEPYDPEKFGLHFAASVGMPTCECSAATDGSGLHERHCMLWRGV